MPALKGRLSIPLAYVGGSTDASGQKLASESSASVSLSSSKQPSLTAKIVSKSVIGSQVSINNVRDSFNTSLYATSALSGKSFSDQSLPCPVLSNT